MVQSLSAKYKKQVAYFLFAIFYLQLLAPLYAAAKTNAFTGIRYYTPVRRLDPSGKNSCLTKRDVARPGWGYNRSNAAIAPFHAARIMSPDSVAMGGPSSPEASSFKAVGSNNLVNLFTGDFSYSIPLLDVGGYPVNLFYSGGVTMEQEASWVGLGWNINPGSVSRNMRGVPDDFNGTDSLIQTQNLKPNKTYGGEVGADAELLGIKEPNLGLSVGFSYNNYLGPAIEIGATVSVSLPLMESVKAEKYAMPNVGASLGAKLSSRSGLTFSPSLSAGIMSTEACASTGIGLSTSYNSRSGISSLNLHAEQVKYYEQGKIVNDDYRSHKSATAISLGSSSISFAKPSYMPTMRMPMQNSYTSGQIEFGGGAYGIRGAVTLNGFSSESKVAEEFRHMKKPLVGFMYSEKANNNVNAVMDFNRVNDAEVTPNTPIISAPMYTYDIFSIQGEGTGGSIRAYRGDLGFMRDNVTVSKDGNLALGLDLAPPGHYGVNVNNVSAPTRIGGWENNNNTLRQTMFFQPKLPGTAFENYYFRNPGEATVTSEEMLNRIGHDSLARFQLGGDAANPKIESQLELYGKSGNVQSTHSLLNKTLLQAREKRTQVTTMLTGDEAARVGLDTAIRNYRTGNAMFDGVDNHLLWDNIQRNAGYRKGHHISEIDVLEQNGMRYVYGLPVYSIQQKDFTFSVDQLPDTNNLVQYDSLREASVKSPFIENSSLVDGYVEIKETPAYASSFLITGLLSQDYVDVTGNGITEDDLGGAVKFNYTMSSENHKWRTPRNNSAGKKQTAHFNEGKRSEARDNKATISYGEREAWYLNSIESKSMVAIFKTDSRKDAKGVASAFNSQIDTSEHANKKLTRIDLYTKSDLRANGIANAKPVKSVLFDYSYDLCKKTPDNNDSGKLTLRSISFAYNGQPRTNKERYVFKYEYGSSTAQKDNPDYAYNASDRWGTYKPFVGDTVNPGHLNNIDYPYTVSNKKQNDQFAGAWSLKKILLPSGGQMEVQYEADDYAYVQDRRACNMFPIYGLGNSTVAGTGNAMYNKSDDNLYVYIKLPAPLQNTDPVKRKAEIFAKYLASLNQLAFKLLIDMPKGPEPLTVYATKFADYGLCTNSPSNDIIYIKLGEQDGKSPLAKSSTGFIIENLTGQAFPGYDVPGVTSLTDFLNLMGTMFKGISKAFTNAENTVRSYNKAKNIVLDKSFIRLANPAITKYGGGSRVKKILVRDNWDKMTGQYVSTYGQDYDYTTTQNINGKETTISSGVASYEPAIGSEENPFREILTFSNKLPLASAQYGAIEMPMLEGFYPSPSVGYSKVTVRSIHRKGTHGDSTLRSAIGKQVSEFYTAKDYPSFSDYTDMASMDYKKDPFFSFFNKEVINRRIISQGFLVTTNDMHGKMKSQEAYSESDEKTPISASYHTYKNTGKNGLNDKVDFVFNKESGTVHSGNMGVDMELMTDVREFSVESRGVNTMGQVDLYFFGPFVIPLPTVFRSRSYIENKYRAVTCTKLINYHAIEDSVIVRDKGSVISTQTIAYDAETGSSLVTRTANEFNDSIYNVSYPAYWAYSGVGAAYANTGLEYGNVTFTDGKITAGVTDQSIFESGDELYVTYQSPASIACPSRSANVYKLWAFDKNKNTTALTVPVKDLVFMDSIGNLFTKTGVNFRILRSGHRNNLGLTVSGATAMKNPIQNTGGIRKLVIDGTDNIVAASAVSFKEKWQTDNDVIVKKTYYTPACSNTELDSISCNGILEKKINPYLKGLVGNLKPYRSYTYYGSRNEDLSQGTTIRKNGYIAGFSNFWGFNTDNNLVPDIGNSKWVWNSELTKVNGKGQELETRDALNRYTAAQYGFNKNMPVAMAQNARYGEAMNEGFEDYNYAERINKGKELNCLLNRYTNLSDLGQILNPSALSIAAHTGQYVLATTTGPHNLILPVLGTVKDSFNIVFQKDTVRSLADPGVVLNNISTFPLTLSYQLTSGSTSANTMFFNMTTTSDTTAIPLTFETGYTRSVGFDIDKKFYIEITTPGTYNLYKHYDDKTNHNYAGSSLQVDMDLNFDFTLSTTEGVFVPYNLVSVVDHQSDHEYTYQVCLAKGIYEVRAYAGAHYSYQCETSSCQDPYDRPAVDFTLNVTPQSGGSPLTAYETLTALNGCISTKAIGSADSMLNPGFRLVPGKRMQFSAWVREKCDSVVCYKPTYANNHIELQFPGSGVTNISFKAKGNIIEGWQKIDTVFTVPANATTANLVLSNDGSEPVYFDDIRIHPFNANMKSYVYDPRTLRLSAELDENNYASFYEYDEEGQLIRAKKETIQGIKTIKETRNAKQSGITELVD